MPKNVKSMLPWGAMLGALLLLVSLASGIGDRAALLIDDGLTRQSVEQSVARVQAIPATSVDDQALRSVVEQLQDAPYVAYVWLFAADGRAVYTNTRFVGATSAEKMATAETQRLLAALPIGDVSTDLQMKLLVASAIQAEGEHNDVFRHMVRPLTAVDGRTFGLLGVAYDVNTGIAAPPSLSYVAALLVMLLGLALYWLALPLWVFLDARSHGERAWAWAAFVLIGNLVALLAYILVRRPMQPATTVDT